MFSLQRWVEFTLDIGCPNNCNYCPQKVFIERYFENDKNRKRSMNLEDFKKILKNIPKEIDIDFAGFGEPFVNPDILDMMEHATNEGYRVHVYTSLRGLSYEQILRLKDIPVSSYVIHLPDRDGLIKLKVNDEYLKNLAAFDALNIPNTEYMVIGRIHDEIPKVIKSHIKEDKIASRAENLDRNAVSEYAEFSCGNKVSIDKNKKILCGRRFHNTSTDARPTCSEITIVLPDGTVVPCCMDWGLKHPLGNLYTQKYEEIIDGPVMRRFEDAMMCKNDDDIICRNCEWSVEWDEKKWKHFTKTGCYCLPESEYTLLEKICSVKNSKDKKHKVLSLLGLKFKIKRRQTSKEKITNAVNDKMSHLERVVNDKSEKIINAINRHSECIFFEQSKDLKEYIEAEIRSAVAVQALHAQVFPKYKNLYKNRDVVVMGSGPSLNDYQPIDGAIHIGVNSVFKYDKVQLDYIFLNDYTGACKYIKELKNYDCVKFCGMHCNKEIYDFDIQSQNPTGLFIPDHIADEIGAIRFYTNAQRLNQIYYDIESKPLMEYFSALASNELKSKMI